MIGRVRSFKRHARQLIDEAETIRRRLHTLAVIERERYIRELLSEPPNDDQLRLLRSGFKIYSQNEEDGIIQEIFARIGHGPRTFVEFGVDYGLENNTLKLLLEGWHGLWLEGSEENVALIRDKFRDVIEQGRLTAEWAFVDRD
ncbi:MAG: hypothetical protein FWD12_15510, partial [Alphaproteobacteria bacterium]|nr:hypothetical protein [Alphaproteobacteria bacterium]